MDKFFKTFFGMGKLSKWMKRITFTGLSALIFATSIQLQSVTTFAASIATSGPYANVDVTSENNGQPESVENEPANEVERPAQDAPSGQDLKTETLADKPWQYLLDQGYKELKDARTAESKTFENSEGLRETFIFEGAIHYLDENDVWQEYNTDLKQERSGLLRSSGTSYTQTATDTKVTIPATIDAAHPVQLALDGTTISIAKDSALTNPEVEKNIMRFEGSQETTEVVALTDSVVMNELYSTMPETIEYTYTVGNGFVLELNTDGNLVDVKEEASGNIVGQIYAPTITDANKEPYNEIATMELEPVSTGKYLLKMNLKNNPEQVPAYPINITTHTVNRDSGSVQVYGINSYDKGQTYGPGKGNAHEDLFMVGDNRASSEYYPLGIYKDFVSTGVNNWRQLLGEHQEIVSAELGIFEFTHSNAVYPDCSDIKVFRIENDYSGRTSNVTWNSWIGSGAGIQNVTSTRVCKDLNTFAKFDIKEAVDAWYGGAGDYGLYLDTNREDEGLLFLNHEQGNDWLAQWGGIDGRPYIKVQHKNAEPIPDDLALDKSTVRLRPFTSAEMGGMIQFQALGFDGIARPGSVVDIEVYEVNDPTKVVYTSNAAATSGFRQYPYYEPPVYPTIEKAQKYYGLSSNWQSPTLLYTKDLQKDVLYQVKIKTKILNADGTVKEEGEWLQGDTFQVYKVKSFDHLPRIMNFYGLTDKTILLKDNHMRDEMVIESNEIFIRNPKKNQGKPYIPAALSDKDKELIDGYLIGQGKHCEFGYEPINLNTGNFYYTNEDARWFDFDDDFSITRSYNSVAGGVESIFGRNWEMSWNKRMTYLENGDIIYHDGTGKRLYFTMIGENQYQAPFGEQMTLTRIQDGTMKHTEDSAYYDIEWDKPKTTTTDVPVYKYVLDDANDDKVYTFGVNGFLEKVKTDKYNHEMLFTYDDLGFLTQIKTPTNKVITFEYNANGYVNKVIMPDNSTLQYEYDDLGNLTAFIDQEGYKLSYLYEDINNPYMMTSYLSRTSGNPVIISNEYDELGRVTKQTDAENRVVTFEYQANATIATNYDGKQEIVYFDANKRTTEKINTDGSSEQSSYDGQNNKLLSATADKEPISYTYDDKGNVLTETRTDGAVKSYTYNDESLTTAITNFDGTTTTFTYDEFNNMTSTNYPDGSSILYAYNNDGQLLSETDRNGNTTTYTYENGNKISENNGLGTKTYSYDPLSMMKTVTDAKGNTITYVRNKRGELVEEQRPGGTLKYQYDADGQKVWQQDANGNAKTFTYDGIGRMLTETDSYGTKSYTYDVNGNISVETDELGFETKYEYDAGNRKVKTIFADGSTETYEYDDRGRLVVQTDQLGNQTKYEYDAITNQKTKMIDAKGNETTYTYDTLGNLLVTTYPNGSKETNVYNDLNQLVEKTDKAGTVTTYTYDFNGNQLTETTGNRTTQKVYSTANINPETIDAMNYSTLSSYDNLGLIDTTTLANGTTQKYQYDGEYNVTAVIDGAGNTVRREYDGNNNKIAEVDAMGNRTEYTYTARNQVATTTYADGGVVQNVYDAKGQQIETVDQLGYSTKTEYNSVGAVVKTTDARGNESSSEYDAKGQQIVSTNALGEKTESQYDELGRLIVQVNPTGIINYYTYDAMGNKVQDNDNFDRFTNYFYDEAGRQIGTENYLGLATATKYDEYGNVVEEVDVRGNITTYEYDANNQLIKKTDAQGNVTESELNGIGQALKDQNNSCDSCGTVNTSETTYYYNNLGLVEKTVDSNGAETQYEYDANYQTTKITNAKGFTQVYAYSPTGLRTEFTDANGGKTVNVYDLKGQLIQKTDPEGNKTQYMYDASGNQTHEIDPLGFAIVSEYDALNRPISTTDKNGNTTTATYNVWGQTEKVEAPNGVTQRSEYDEKGQLVKVIDPNGNVTTTNYDIAGRVENETQANGYKTTNTYNKYGDLLTVTDNLGDTLEQNTYNQFGQVTEKVDGNKNKTQYEYNSLNQITKVTAANGNTIEYTYNIDGTMASMVDARGNDTEYQYDVLGQVSAIKAPGEKDFNYTYDGNGNLLSETDALGYLTQYQYNKNNQQTVLIDAKGNQTKTVYDERGLIESQIDAKNNITQIAYDANGNKTLETDALGNSTAFEYDENNRLITTSNRLGAETAYAYDNNGNHIKTTNANGGEVKFGYDNMNNRTSIRTNDGKSQAFTYDGKGNLTKEIKQDSRAITYKYDALNNQIYKDFDNQQYTYKYNSENQVTEVVDTKTKTTYKYNQYGDLTSYTDQNGQTVKYQYDEIGRKIGLTYPNGKQVHYEYDANDRLTKVVDGSELTAYEYDELNNLTKTTLPNGNVTTYQYDEVSNLTKLQTVSALGTILVNMEYGYDARNQIFSEKSLVDGVTTEKSYTYDAENQLVASIHKTGNVTKEYTYLYDMNGNKLSAKETVNGKVTGTQYSFDKDNKLTNEDASNNMDVSYKYDAQGNVSEKRHQNGLVEKYSYSAEGQLIQVQSNNGKTVTYSYDGFGNRTQKVEKTTIEQSEGSSFLSFLKDDKSYNEDYDQKLVSQTTGEQLDNLRQTISDHLETYNQTCPVDDEDGPKTSSTILNYVNDINQEYTQVLQVQTSNYQPLNTYVYGVQRIENEKANDANTFYQYDGRGSVIGQNKNGTPEKLAFQIKYDDFGQTNRKVDNEFGYNAEAHDNNNTQYLRARYYDTGTGRFNQQDSYLGTQEETISQNRYAYTNNNFVNNIDPSGHSPRDMDPKEEARQRGIYNCEKTYENGAKTVQNWKKYEACVKKYGGKVKYPKPSDASIDMGHRPDYETDPYSQSEADAWEADQIARFNAIQEDNLRRQEAEALAAAHGIHITLDGYSGADLLRVIKQIIKICAEVRMGLSVAEAQAKANSLVEKVTGNGIVIPILTVGSPIKTVTIVGVGPEVLGGVDVSWLEDAIVKFLAAAGGVISGILSLPIWGMLGLAAISLIIMGSVAKIMVDVMVNASDAAIEDEITDILAGFDAEAGACDIAAGVVIAQLRKMKVDVQFITIVSSPRNADDKTWHLIYSEMKAVNVSANGYHVGVLFKSKVFCTYHKTGLAESTWINDMFCQGIKTVIKSSGPRADLWNRS